MPEQEVGQEFSRKLVYSANKSSFTVLKSHQEAHKCLRVFEFRLALGQRIADDPGIPRTVAECEQVGFMAECSKNNQTRDAEGVCRPWISQ
eukprot:COSAG02_NODE_905_length_16042_cov_60.273600_3_plen_91_part_00